jgi:hypothetical protein
MFLFRRFAPTIPIENSSLSGICSFRSHISEKMFLSLRDLLVSLAHLRENVPLSPGFARFTRTSPRKCSSLSGICSFHSHISEKMFLSLRDLLTAFAHPSPPAAGLC